MSAVPQAAQAFLDALAARDFDALGATFAPAIAFRALVPGEQVAVHTAREAADSYRRWFDDKSDFTFAEVRADVLVDKVRVAFEARVSRKGERLAVSQSLVGDVEDERFATLDVVCSGFRPLPGAASAGTIHVFDAGDLGCGSGLPREFRTRISQIPVGQVLEVLTADPSAREDLPSMARLLGHDVRAVDQAPDGRTRIRVERTK